MRHVGAVIAALQSEYDSLASLVSGLSDDDLAGPSGASEWDISQVLSHLGSGAEINQASIQAAVDGKPSPGLEFARSVWDRWDAMDRRQCADGFLRVNPPLLGLYESLAARDDLRINMFWPVPVDLTTAGLFRLAEFALHSWDVRVGFDPGATLAPETTGLILPAVGGLAGDLGKPEPLSGRQAVIQVTTSAPDFVLALHLGDKISIGDAPEQADGTLTLPA